MARRDERGRPLVSPRPKSKEEGQLEAQENQAVYNQYLNAGLNKDPISLLGLAPNMFRDTGNDNPLDAHYVAQSPDLQREDTMYFSSTNKGSKDAVAHESRHRGFARIKDLYDAAPEGFTEKYGEAAAVILRSDSEVQNELFDDPNAQITPEVSMRDTFEVVNPDFVAHQKKTGSFIGGESDFTMKNERLQAGVLGLQRAALDLLDREGRMPLDEGDEGGPKTRPNNKPAEEEGFFSGIKKALGFAEGGTVMAEDDQMEAVFKSRRTDPVSGNEVPTGSLPEEVRDDIPANLSEGEYVVPADVVRYYGVKFFEDLRSEAKSGWSEMEQGGRVGGGAPEMEAEDDALPFDPSELQAIEMAEGGFVNNLAEGGMPSAGGYTYEEYENAKGEIIVIPFFNGKPMGIIPEGYFPKGEAPKQEQKSSSSSDQPSMDAPEPVDYSKFTLDELTEKVDSMVTYGVDDAVNTVFGALNPMVGSVMKLAMWNDTKQLNEELNRRLADPALTTYERDRLTAMVETAEQGRPKMWDSLFGKGNKKTPTVTAPAPTTGGGSTGGGKPFEPLPQREVTPLGAPPPVTVTKLSDVGGTKPVTQAKPAPYMNKEETQEEVNKAVEKYGVRGTSGGRAKGGLVTKRKK